MQKKLINMFAVVALVVSAIPAWGEAPSNTTSMSQYRLGPGDLVRIDVYEEKSLSVEGVLTDAGTISYPFLGEVMAKGHTIGELSAQIATALKGPYLRDPQVSVNVLKYRDFYVNGEVNKPGNYAYVPGLTVLKAIAVAGGYTQRAKRKDVQLISESGNAVQEGVHPDATVGPGDIITVEESFF